jgi:Flp pilus assembly protein CpaB
MSRSRCADALWAGADLPRGLLARHADHCWVDTERLFMELEYKDDRRKGRFVILAGVVLALVAGGIAFYTINQAQQQASDPATNKITLVVAVATIPAREAVKAADVTVREVPLDPTNANGVISDANLVIGRIAAVTILQGQLVTTNMLASATEGAPFSILTPDESFGPDTAPWRAISITVSDDLAVGGMLTVGESVDVFVTTVVSVPDDPTGKYISDRSTKVTYQDVTILARKDQFYIIRAPVDVAEEIAHLQATGVATFSLALRPLEDQRQVDATALGETTSKIIQKYGLPIPQAIVPGFRPSPTPTPVPSESPSPDPAASAAPAASGRPAASSGPADLGAPAAPSASPAP